jgi:hypothetical protein
MLLNDDSTSFGGSSCTVSMLTIAWLSLSDSVSVSSSSGGSSSSVVVVVVVGVPVIESEEEGHE